MEEENRTDYFKDYHPAVNFGFYIFVTVLSFITNNVYLQTILFSSSIIYNFYLKGFRRTLKNLSFIILSMFLLIIGNFLVNHQGVTVLGYMWDGNPITLESIIYGISAAVMLATVVLWFATYNEIMTSDKFIYLFGKVIPKSSLIFSMVLRFVPLYKEQIIMIEKAQRTIGRGIKDEGIINKIKNSLNILSVFVTWALENSIETSDSMKARGYGLKGRTAFSNYKMTARDYTALGLIISTSVYVIYLFFKKTFRMVYYPMIKISKLNARSFIGFAAIAMLANLPMIINIAEEIKWRGYEKS